MSLWKEIVRIAAPIAGAIVGGPVGTILTGGIISRMLPPDERDQFEEWAKYAEKLGETSGITNVERGDRLEARVRKDLFQLMGEEPKDRRVKWLVETVVMSISGDFES